MPKPNIIRVGDRVRIVTPTIVTRVGYPKTVKEYEPLAKELFGAELEKHLRRGHTFDKVIRDIAYGLAKKDGFGGRERSLHLKDVPGILDQEFYVSGARMVRTGTYYPPQYSSSYYGESDYEPGGLANAKSHKLLAGFSVGYFHDLRERLEISVGNVVMVEQ